MIITKEQQEMWIYMYAKKHSQDEVIGFIDGIEKVVNYISNADKKAKKTTKKRK
jgi:hypothetical protein